MIGAAASQVVNQNMRRKLQLALIYPFAQLFRIIFVRRMHGIVLPQNAIRLIQIAAAVL